MSRQYNPAVAAYTRMDLDGFAQLQEKETPIKSNGLLSRSSKPENNKSGIDYTNPLARVAKQMLVVRKYRDEINGSK
jgi:hypothetical protein